MVAQLAVMPIATAVGEFAAPYLLRKAGEIGLTRFIQVYGGAAAASIGIQKTQPVDLQTEKIMGMPVSHITGQGEVYDDIDYSAIDEDREVEPLKYIDTVHGGKGPLEPIKAKGFPAQTEVKKWDESFKAPEPIETNKGLEVPSQERVVPPGFETPDIVDTSILTKDISKQTKDLVKEEPEFGALTETEKQTARLEKGDKPDYYSRVAKAVEGSQEIATAEQWMGIIQGQGATEAELDYLGLTDLLKGKEKITKENLLKHIKEKDISSRITTTRMPDKDRKVVEYETFRLGGTDSKTFETYLMQFDVTKDKEGKYLPHDEPITYRAPPEHVGKEQYGRNTFLTLRTQIGYSPSLRGSEALKKAGDDPLSTSEMKAWSKEAEDHNKWAKEISEIFKNTLIGDEVQLDLVQRGRLTGFEKDFDAVKGSDLITYLDKNKIKYEIETDPLNQGFKDYQAIRLYHSPVATNDLEDDRDFTLMDFTPNTRYIFGHPLKKLDARDARIDRTKPKEFKKRVTVNAWTGKLSDHIKVLPNFPITNDKKVAELGIMELIRIAVENGNDSIAIPGGQILADRYSSRENLKVGQKILLDATQKIAKRNNTAVTEYVIQKKKEFTKESGLHFEGTVDWVNEAREQGYSLKKITREELKDLLYDPSDPEGRIGEFTLARQEIPDFISMMTENAYSRNIGNIGDELSIESSQDKSYYIWQDSSGAIKFELPIVGANEAEIYMADETRDTETSAYVEGLSENPTERTYLEYLFNKIEEYQGKAKGTREDHKLYKMKIPKKFQKKRLSESYKFTKNLEDKTIGDQTDRMFG